MVQALLRSLALEVLDWQPQICRAEASFWRYKLALFGSLVLLLVVSVAAFRGSPNNSLRTDLPLAVFLLVPAVLNFATLQLVYSALLSPTGCRFSSYSYAVYVDLHLSEVIDLTLLQIVAILVLARVHPCVTLGVSIPIYVVWLSPLRHYIISAPLFPRSESAHSTILQVGFILLIHLVDHAAFVKNAPG